MRSSISPVNTLPLPSPGSSYDLPTASNQDTSSVNVKNRTFAVINNVEEHIDTISQRPSPEEQTPIKVFDHEKAPLDVKQPSMSRCDPENTPWDNARNTHTVILAGSNRGVFFSATEEPTPDAGMTPESLATTSKVLETAVVPDGTKVLYQEEEDHELPTIEMTTESPRLALSDGEPAIVPDLADCTYHEEDDEDDASIHHGTEDEDDTISVADYIDRESLSNSKLQLAASSSARETDLADDRALPAHLHNELERWYARHGRNVPNCATCRRCESSMSDLWCRQKTGAPVTWLHRSGVALEVTWYHLPGTHADKEGKCPKLIVVSGTGLAPSIVAYKCAGASIEGIKEKGVVYRIWRGLDGDVDGFERSPSVIKVGRGPVTPKANSLAHQFQSKASSMSDGRPRLPHPSGRCYGCVSAHLACDRRSPVCGRCARMGRRCVYGETPSSKSGITNVQSKQTNGGTGLQRSERSRKPAAKDLSVDSPPSRKRKLTDRFPDQEHDEQSDVLLSSFIESPPLTSSASPISPKSTGSKRWACYLCDTVRSERKQLRFHVKTAHGVDVPDESRMRRTDRRRSTQNTQHVAGLREAARIRDATNVRSRPGEVLESESEAHYAHIETNTKLMFFSHGLAPRVRCFSACDSVQKLFAQAIAGGVFTKETARVLAIEIEDQEIELPVVEDDEEDFCNFREQLIDASCWSVRGDRVLATLLSTLGRSVDESSKQESKVLR